MAIARLPVILVLVLYFLQNHIHGQQIPLISQSNSGTVLNPSVSSDPKIAELIASVKNSQCQKCANNGFTLTTTSAQQYNNPAPQQAGLQQNLNLQQQTAAAPLNFQPLALNSQAPLDPQTTRPVNSQQALTLQQCANQNLIHSINLQPLNPQPCVNTNANSQQQLVFQQPIQQPAALQPLPQQPAQVLQQQQLSVQPQISLVPLNNLEIIAQQNPAQREIPLSSLPMVNSQVQGLPSQVSQGILLSNLGLPSLLSNSCLQPSADKVSVTVPQSNVPPTIMLLNGGGNPNLLPASAASSSPPLETVATNLYPQSPFFIPINLQNTVLSQQNQPYDIGQTSVGAIQCQPPQQQLLIHGQPAHSESQCVQPVQAQLTQTQYHLQPVQSQPVCITQNQQSILQEKETSPPSSPLESFLLSQLQTSANNPSGLSSNQGSKSSTMKALLPLLFNLLKEKNGGCGCPPNFNNCCCMNNKPDQQFRNPCANSNHFNSVPQAPNEDCNKLDKNKVKPQVFDGYSNQVKYGQPKDKKGLVTNFVESEETESSTKTPEAKKYYNYKKKVNESLEYEDDDDYEDSYENED